MLRRPSVTKQDLESQSSASGVPQTAPDEHQLEASRPSIPVPIVIKVTGPSSDSQGSMVSPSFDKLYDGCGVGVAESGSREDGMFLPQPFPEMARDTGVVQSRGNIGGVRKFLESFRGYQKLSEVSVGDSPCN